MRWCEENTLNFVKLYLEKEHLWNPVHDWYKLKSKREVAYSEIIEQFRNITGKCMTIPEVKLKIKYLRSTYTQQVQKILLRSSPDCIYKPSLVWFHEMDRCLKYVPNEKHKDAVVDFSQENQDESSDVHQAWACENKTLATNLEEESSDPLFPWLYTDNDYATSATQESAVVVKLEEDSSPEYTNIYLKRKRRKLKKPSHYIIRSQIESWCKEDEFDIYGKYIASQLRQMDLQVALKVQLQIQNLVKEAMVSVPED